MSRINLDFLVTGTGRCGTVYMAKLLSSLGIMCGHEAIFTFDGFDRAKDRLQKKSKIFSSECSIINIKSKESIPNWFDPQKIQADSSYLAAPFLKENILQNTKIIHLVRSPLKVISSHVLDVNFFKYPNDKQILWQNFVLTYLPKLKDITTEIERACYYYIQWNDMIQKSRECFLHKIEDGCTLSLLNFLGISEAKENLEISTETNSWGIRKKDLRLEDIPKGIIKNKFIECAEKYGYQICDSQ
jgi:hypothetical protein